LKIIHMFIVVSLYISCSSCDSKNDAEDDDTTIVTPEPPVVVVPPPAPGPVLPDAELLDLAEKDALKYFWEYAEPNSKLARERYHTDDPSNDAQIVTTGGSGFGLMTILVGIERGFIPRGEAVARLQTALNFLKTADRFHGAWPHWMNGTNGKVIPFGTVDNGGDLVETSFLCQGLLCLREYFKDGNPAEKALAQQADELWKGVEWSWYTKGENALYWHWSPQYAWQLNFKLEGYNECLITYVMAAASPTYPVGAAAYHQAWARNGAIKHSGQRYNIPVIFNYNGASGNVGPMFWSHYSYLGMDPRGLTDTYANYWDLVQNHARIQHAYSVANPYGWAGYGDNCWGLTASYTRNENGSTGYTAHSPTNDKGVISPTAAMSSFPYMPAESMKATRFFYETWHARLIGVAGPYDAFSPHYNWVTPRYLAIDQGTITPMIENYRTGMLWNLFMQAPEVKQGLLNLGFHSSQHNF
jgi:hypothetical protein